jgi:hypothetical protein
LIRLTVALLLPHIAVSLDAISVRSKSRDVLQCHLQDVLGLSLAAVDDGFRIDLSPFLGSSIELHFLSIFLEERQFPQQKSQQD